MTAPILDKAAVLENLQGMLREQREELSKAQALREYPRLLHLLVWAGSALRSPSQLERELAARAIEDFLHPALETITSPDLEWTRLPSGEFAWLRPEVER